jgi:hypothetical protein
MFQASVVINIIDALHLNMQGVFSNWPVG